VRLVVIDLIPALLVEEGRDSLAPVEEPAVLVEALEDLYADFRLAAIADADLTGVALRDALERIEAAPLFESIGTSAGFGPQVTPRVVRRVAAALGSSGPPVVITGRDPLADALRLAAIPAVRTGTGGFAEAAIRIRRIGEGGLSR